MSNADHLRALADEARALQQRVHDTVDASDMLTPDAAFRLGEASAALGEAALALEAGSKLPD